MEIPPIPHKDTWITTDQGDILSRCWRPASCRSRTPIVLFHDSLGCIELWRAFPALLAEQTQRQVIAYDRLGFGQSDLRTDKPGIDFIEEEALRYFPVLRRQLGIERFIAFGHSVGGGMAVHCAAHHAPDCEALITVSAQAFVEDRTRAGIMAAREDFAQAASFERLRRYHGEKARWVLDTWVDIWLSPGFGNWTLDGVLPRVDCPTLVIHGENDEYGSAAHPRRIANGIGTRARMTLLPETGHVPHREDGHGIARRIAGFLEERAGTTPEAAP
ncbi:alpha/beta fold hydrolase [Paludibacterium paludis]|uniref:Hydrolase n=1 Tax=Paludibacterium paludis TaxID=1225769 RepID=A0A918P3K1_9NEIS|nr:alpha/beta hydrolase [Paludibacterium paludis]GGY17005.1 hydrolase [Paludibacterium paludis]